MERAAQDEVANQDHLPSNNKKVCSPSLVAAVSSDPNAASCHHDQQYCSFAVTGKHEAFQAIYVCYTCCEDSSNITCVCQACADACHADHDGLEYIGMGPSYCDCHSMVDANDGKPVCHIVQASEDEAQRLNLAVHGGLSNQPASEALSSAYRMESYAIPELDDESQTSYLCDLAQELVRHSKETFWIEPSSDDKSLYCDLERLACAIYHKHHAASNAQFSGAEWWVQVKPVASRATSEEAVDMHYDKDEQVAETFGLGCFPLFSTVTYLTGRGIDSKQSWTVPAQAPTLVLSRKYDDVEEGDTACASVVFLSHPRRGKHILFDGRLLHGAPAHMSLRERRTTKIVHSSEPSSLDLAPMQHHRVTFLVNLWLGHKPAGVSPLPDFIRQALYTVQTTLAVDDTTHTSSASTTSSARRVPIVGNGLCQLNFQALPVLERTVTAADVVPDRRLHLPFVGKNATWGNIEDDDNDDDNERELVVSMSVPPLDVLDDTVLFRFVDPAIGPSLISPSSESDHED